MNSALIPKIFSIMDDLKFGGYEHFMNYEVFKRLLYLPNSFLTKLYQEVIRLRPDIDLVNLVCTVNGALNYVGTSKMSLENATVVFDDINHFETFIDQCFQEIISIALSRNNNPTIPQRAISVARFMSAQGAIGILELGCSRGDIGMVLLNLHQVLNTGEKYFFDDFDRTVDLENFTPGYSVNKYFGIDLDISIDDEWLLSLWGLKDERRIKLQNFYTDFKPTETSNFSRLSANACDISAYKGAVCDFFSTEQTLVILTSFMLYQLSFDDRLRLVRSIKEIQETFCKNGQNRQVLWLDQGMQTQNLLSKEFKFSECFVSRLWFVDKNLVGHPVARLNNDACEGWKVIDSQPSILWRDI